MQTHRLVSHPAFAPGQVSSVAVRWGRVADGRIMLRYRVDGCSAMIVPPLADPERTDGLWQHTCFELFLAGSEGSYREFNFSPSGAWAAYDFAGYRNRTGDLPVADAPQIATDKGVSVFTQTVFLDPVHLVGATHAALTAVIEEERGRKSYWALRHPGLQPDFHNPACFVVPVP